MTENLLIYMVAGLAGVLYALLVGLWRRLVPESGMTAMWVVIGNALVAGIFGLLEGVEMAAELVIVLAVMGVPQVVGYQIEWALERRRERRELR